MKSRSLAPRSPSQLRARHHLALHVANQSRHVDRGSGRQIAGAILGVIVVALICWALSFAYVKHSIRFHDAMEAAR
jgi:hypothetical protein